MKTVKRKAEVGEKVRSLRSGKIGVVRKVFEDGLLEVFCESDMYTGNVYMSDGNYEVIIEDEPKTAVTHIGGHRIEIDEDNSVREYGPPAITVDDPPIPPHSSHYHQNGLAPLEVMRRTFPPEQYEGFLRGSLLKYTMRYDRKGQEAEDLGKAEFYSEALKRWKEGVE